MSASHDCRHLWRFSDAWGKRKRPLWGRVKALSAQGLGLINAETVLERDKKTYEVKARASLFGEEFELSGYEIHMGETNVNDASFATITMRGGTSVDVRDGAAIVGSMLWGTYIHGIFDNDRFTQSLVARLKKKKGGRTRRVKSPIESLWKSLLTSLPTRYQSTRTLPR